MESKLIFNKSRDRSKKTNEPRILFDNPEKTESVTFHIRRKEPNEPQCKHHGETSDGKFYIVDTNGSSYDVFLDFDQNILNDENFYNKFYYLKRTDEIYYTIENAIMH